jgi:outer membrane protein OmpA-like peptidoglycan-associated protein
MSFCTNCGNAVSDTIQFCTKCGARQTPISTPVTPPAGEWQPVSQAQPVATLIQPAATSAPQPYPVVKTRSALPFVLIVLAILALLAVVGVGSVVYVGYRVKQKVSSVAKVVAEHAPTPANDTSPKASPAGEAAAGNSDVSSMLGNLGSLLGGGNDEGDPVESISSKDPLEPCTPARFPAQDNARIPLRPGTVITTAWGMLHGDVESRESVDSVDPTSVTFTSKTNEYEDDNDRHSKGSTSTHTVCNADFQAAANYATVTGRQPRIIHDLTRVRLTDKDFQEIKSTGKLSNFVYWDVTVAGDDNLKPNHEGGVLTRVEPQDVPYPMIVNDERVTLPAIHLTGITVSQGKDPRPKKYRPYHTETDLYVIDDPLDPMVLLLKMKDPALHDQKFRIENTKIDFPVPHPINTVEKQLAETKKAVTWGIYFDFNKDTIKPESETVLKEIVQAMTDNPGWKLNVEGHTDNIGGDAYNLDLSKRRAAAVKQALVSRYHVAADRLSTDGYGASHPIETNDTLEGRARNRRVELTRE